MITIDLTEQEAELFIVLRKAGFFDLEDETDIVIHKKNGVITDIKKCEGIVKQKIKFLYQRKKGLDIIAG